MKKNKLIAYALILFALLVPLNFGFLSIEQHEGVVSLIMMVLIEFLIIGALVIGVDQK